MSHITYGRLPASKILDAISELTFGELDLESCSVIRQLAIIRQVTCNNCGLRSGFSFESQQVYLVIKMIVFVSSLINLIYC